LKSDSYIYVCVGNANTHWRWEKTQEGGAADKNRERERERERERGVRETQSNYTGSFHKPERVMSPLHFQGEFTKM